MEARDVTRNQAYPTINGNDGIISSSIERAKNARKFGSSFIEQAIAKKLRKDGTLNSYCKITVPRGKKHNC